MFQNEAFNIVNKILTIQKYPHQYTLVIQYF